ncbi:hypothetical protein AZE42_09456 [Rhizopogon vesiculosus]|uniref:Uncharacterized protein n=1 Tax=Rhizopogon vesiculosus TaxID=180088 RepID=A0A1J8QU91_9AGAM|nr:hypothetical protein AZE42_09456 [Rhizopogon vesiculosus]
MISMGSPHCTGATISIYMTAELVLKHLCYNEHSEIKMELTAMRTVYPLIAKNLIPIATWDFRIFDPEDEEPPMSRMCQDEADPLPGEVRLGVWVWLLEMRGTRT